MTYIDLINAFNQWCESNYLPILAQTMYYKLLSIFNKAGWCEWVQVDNLRLMSVLQIKSEKSLILYRDKLVEARLIEYQKGKKGYPNRYKINTVNFTVQTTVKKTVKTTVKREVQTTDIDRLRLRQDKDKDRDNNKCCSNNNYSAEIEKFNSNNIFITPANYEKACCLIDEFTPDWITEAISRACNQNNRNLNYVEGILRSWKNKGYSTLAEITKEYKPKESLEEKVFRVLGGGK